MNCIYYPFDLFKGKSFAIYRNTDSLQWRLLFIPLDQLNIQVEGLGFGETLDPGHDLQTHFTKGNALVSGQLEDGLAVQCALLHDVLEDTPTTYQEIKKQFGKAVAEGVLALSKDNSLPKEHQMEDSLARIRLQPKEVWMVKLADRITNLAPPPAFWTREKRQQYLQDALFIYESLKDASATLGNHLLEKIEEYRQYC